MRGFVLKVFIYDKLSLGIKIAASFADKRFKMLSNILEDSTKGYKISKILFQGYLQGGLS